MSDIDLTLLGENARAAAAQLALATSDAKNEALGLIADALERASAEILEHNAADLDACQKAGKLPYYLERMTLSESRIEDIAVAARKVADMDDPIGAVLEQNTRPDGLEINRVRVPLGVIGVIFESRPNVTVDIGSLCLKSGNAVILRGGSDAIQTNQKLVELIRASIQSAGLPPDAVQLIQSTDRALVTKMLGMDRYIDLMIPRGSAELVETVKNEATMPAIAGGAGICHTYVDADASVDMATAIVLNAKTERPSVCNAMDTLIVHKNIAGEFLPHIAAKFTAAGVEMRVDKRALSILGPKKASTNIKLAGESDFDTEFLGLTASITVVDHFDAALDHIRQHGSAHSEAIVTDDKRAADRFLQEVDAAAVFWNASTYFNDGGEFGLGSEVAVSTGKLHARGPVGMRDLTTYKWQVAGTGHVRTKA